MNKAFQYISYATLISTLLLMVMVAYWLVYPYNPITFNNLPLKVDNKIVKVGDFLVYNVDYCKDNDLIPTASKSFVNQIIYVLPAEIVAAKEEGCAVVKIYTTVPLNLPLGPYYFKVTYRYQVNPIMIKEYTIRTEEFTVTK